MVKINFKIDQKPASYPKSIDFMENIAKKIHEKNSNELIWITSHNPVYTAGVSAKETDLLSAEIPVIKTNRGGKYTYHDEGMRIIYVMLNLKNVFAPNNPDVSKFVIMLENWVINILANFGIKGEIRTDRVGIWVKCPDGSEKKIAAMGIKLRKWVSFHGIAININPDLKAFEKIIPCGISEFGITSMDDLKKKVSIVDFDEVIKKEFFKIFKNYEIN